MSGRGGWRCGWKMAARGTVAMGRLGEERFYLDMFCIISSHRRRRTDTDLTAIERLRRRCTGWQDILHPSLPPALPPSLSVVAMSGHEGRKIYIRTCAYCTNNIDVPTVSDGYQ